MRQSSDILYDSSNAVGGFFYVIKKPPNLSKRSAVIFNDLLMAGSEAGFEFLCYLGFEGAW